MNATINPDAPHPAIQAAQSPLDVVNAALADPNIQAVITQYLGTSAHGPLGAAIGTVFSAVLLHFGIAQPSPAVWTLVCGAGAAAGGYAWTYACNRWLKPKVPAA